jgi:hypothetical protein
MQIKRRDIFKMAVVAPVVSTIVANQKKYTMDEITDLCPDGGVIEIPANYDPGYDLSVKIITRKSGQRARERILYKFKWYSANNDETGSLWVKI